MLNYSSSFCKSFSQVFIVSILILFAVTSVFAAPPEGISRESYVSGAKRPTTMTFSPDGTLYIAEQEGNLRFVKNNELSSKSAISLSVLGTDERGLLGIAFDPGFQSNQFVYLYYTTSGDEQENRLSRFKFMSDDPDIIDMESEQLLVKAGSAAGYHNGGAITIGKDNMLYLGLGDLHDKEDGEKTHHSQNLENLLGKILRLDISPGSSSIIPSDNPFVGMPNVKEEIFAYGLRNPFTMDTDPVSGDIFINDVGQLDKEEVNKLVAGANYGWPECEGSCDNDDYTNPIHEYDHKAGCAITGGTFYNGTNLDKKYLGGYFFTDYCSPVIWFRDSSGNVEVFDRDSILKNVLDLDVGPDGKLYALLRSGEVLTYTGKDTATNTPPNPKIEVSVMSDTAPFTVSFSGEQTTDIKYDIEDLKFEWNFGDGRKGEGVETNNVYEESGSYEVSLKVTNPDGIFATIKNSVTLAENDEAPKAVINLPKATTKFTAGTSMMFSGTATSGSQESEIEKENLTWKVDLIIPEDNIRGKVINLVPETKGTEEGEVNIPDDVFGVRSDAVLKVTLTAVNDEGLTNTVIRDIAPNLVGILVETEPKGIPFRLNDKSYDNDSGETEFSVVKGSKHEISVEQEVVKGEKKYIFSSWSNDKPREHSFKIDATEMIKATFVASETPEVPADDDDMTPRQIKRKIRRLKRQISRFTTRNARNDKKIMRHEQRAERLKNQLENPDLRESRKTRIQSRIDKITTRIAGVEARIESNENLIKVANEELVRIEGTDG